MLICSAFLGFVDLKSKNSRFGRELSRYSVLFGGVLLIPGLRPISPACISAKECNCNKRKSRC